MNRTGSPSWTTFELLRSGFSGAPHQARTSLCKGFGGQRDFASLTDSSDVEVRWTKCGAEVDAADARTRPDFIVRARVGGHIGKAGSTSLEVMGSAFLDVDGAGDMADVYYGPIRELTLQYPVADADRVMGYSMAHELGHPLIGAGHRPNGIMRAAWGEKELGELSRRHLYFNEAERAAILRKLRRCAADSACMAKPE